MMLTGLEIIVVSVVWLIFSGFLVEWMCGPSNGTSGNFGLWSLIGIAPAAVVFMFGTAYFIYGFIRWLF